MKTGEADRQGKLEGSKLVPSGWPGVRTLQLTVIGAFDGVVGDTIQGDNNYSLPVETVLTGLISIWDDGV